MRTLWVNGKQYKYKELKIRDGWVYVHLINEQGQPFAEHSIPDYVWTHGGSGYTGGVGYKVEIKRKLH